MTSPPRPLHAAPQRPYYIEAPAYRRTSAGIRVMHMLCHLLNRSGHDAYLYPTAATNPLWHTPLLTTQLVQQHAQAGRRPITVYPEIVSGNPRNGTSVVRYLLNRPGLIGGDTQFPASDLVFAYTQHLLPAGENPDHVLFMPPIDSSIFHNRNNPHDRQRKGWLLYPGRHAAGLEEHKDLAARCTLITSIWPASPQEMAELFRRSERVYCFESTSIGTEAILCGCPAIVLPSPYFNGTPLGVEELGTHGLAFDDTPQALQEAIESIPIAQEKYASLEALFWEQLEVFIRDTQVMPDTPVIAPHPGQNIQKKNFPIQSWLDQRRPGKAQSQLISQRFEAHPQSAPRIDFILLPGAESSATRATLHSLQADGYPHAAVHVAASTDAAALNVLAAQSTAAWLCFVLAGTTLAPAGITRLALELMDASACRAVYADEIVHEPTGKISTLLRPDFNLDMFLSWPAAMARHWFFRRDVFLEAGGFDPAYADAREFELLLRLIETGGLNRLGHVHEPLFIASPPPLANSAHEVAAIERHLRTRGYAQALVDTSLPGRYRILYGHAVEPLVSVIVVAQDQPALAERCVRRLLEKTGYPNYEVLLVAADTHAWLDGLRDARVRVLRHPHPLNLPARQNMAAREARGEYLVLLGEGAAVLQEGWIDALLNHALRPEVGIVGAKLLHADGTVQHAGVVLGLRGPADHPFMGADANDPGYMQRLQIDQDYSAVTGACLMVRRSLYEQVGGLDEQDFAASYGDVDLCLKAARTGHLVVWTPHAVLLNEAAGGQQQRSAFVSAQDAMYRKWLPQIARDPAYNQNLSLAGQGFELETALDLNWNPLPWRPLPTVLALAADGQGSGHYRVIHPALTLSAAGLADVRLSLRHWLPAEMERLQPDAWILQNQVREPQIEMLRRQAQFTKAFKVAELDDYLPGLPAAHAQRAHLPDDVLGALRRSVALADRLVVPTEALAEALAGLHPDIRVLPTRLPPVFWRGLGSQRRASCRPRVGWVGRASHQGDLAQIADVVRALAGEVEWVFLGACPAPLRPCLHELHEAVPIDQYPHKLASLNLDLAVAPLEPGLFNECKGPQRLLEYGACGVPVVCSDLKPYRGRLPVMRVPNRFEDWMEAIRAHTHDPDASACQGERLRDAVLADWMLEGAHLAEWADAWLPP
ncbi:glycosyltransferase [Xylophilus sp. ASV27]|uniref:glycosyltransferase n=1 Tax=Xylophilus sp. ASV27 TaxID=2795129 RepID=UPI0018ECB931|nr:glycosyltransferase [Xylophilus sp. ASV27]